MKTSSWRLYQGPGRVSISRFAPSSAAPGYAVCRRLIPGPWSRIGGRWVDHATFVAGYAAQLAALDPQATLDAIVARAAPHEPVLMCWEVPPWHYPKHWCHRTTVAEWFQARIGILVEELAIPPAQALQLGRGMVPFWAAGSAPAMLGAQSAALRASDAQLTLPIEDCASAATGCVSAAESLDRRTD